MSICVKAAYDREGKRKYLTRNEGKRFLESVVQLPKLRALFGLTLYYTGCRISEALAVSQNDLDCEVGVLLIRTLKQREHRHIRRVPVPKFLVNELQALELPDPGVYIWSFSRTTAWRIIKSVMKDAGILGIHGTTKGLRHGFGVRGALNQVPLTTIQIWMGHADLETTAIYLAVQDEEERALIERTW